MLPLFIFVVILLVSLRSVHLSFSPEIADSRTSQASYLNAMYYLYVAMRRHSTRSCALVAGQYGGDQSVLHGTILRSRKCERSLY